MIKPFTIVSVKAKFVYGKQAYLIGCENYAKFLIHYKLLQEQTKLRCYELNKLVGATIKIESRKQYDYKTRRDSQLISDGYEISNLKDWAKLIDNNLIPEGVKDVDFVQMAMKRYQKIIEWRYAFDERILQLVTRYTTYSIEPKTLSKQLDVTETAFEKSIPGGYFRVESMTTKKIAEHSIEIVNGFEIRFNRDIN